MKNIGHIRSKYTHANHVRRAHMISYPLQALCTLLVHSIQNVWHLFLAGARLPFPHWWYHALVSLIKGRRMTSTHSNNLNLIVQCNHILKAFSVFRWHIVDLEICMLVCFLRSNVCSGKISILVSMRREISITFLHREMLPNRCRHSLVRKWNELMHDEVYK